MMHKKARKQFAEDKQTCLCTPGCHHTRLIPSEQNKFILVSSDHRTWFQENKDKCVWPTVKHGGGSVMVGAA